MTNKIITYRLNYDGTIPAYIQEGGYFPNTVAGVATDLITNQTGSTSHLEYIGVTRDDSLPAHPNQMIDDVGIINFASEASIKTYLDTYTTGWVDTNPSTGSTSNFDQVGVASFIWSKKIA